MPDAVLARASGDIPHTTDNQVAISDKEKRTVSGDDKSTKKEDGACERKRKLPLTQARRMILSMTDEDHGTQRVGTVVEAEGGSSVGRRLREDGTVSTRRSHITEMTYGYEAARTTVILTERRRGKRRNGRRF
jgi:hypothetical protein